jgi:hypothetical protein
MHNRCWMRAARLKDDYDISQIVQSTAIDERRLASLVTQERLHQYAEIKMRTQVDAAFFRAFKVDGSPFNL